MLELLTRLMEYQTTLTTQLEVGHTHCHTPINSMNIYKGTPQLTGHLFPPLVPLLLQNHNYKFVNNNKQPQKPYLAMRLGALVHHTKVQTPRRNS